MKFLKLNKTKISNILMFIWLFVFVILFAVITKPEEEMKRESIGVFFIVISIVLILGGLVVNFFKPQWAVGIGLFIIGFNFLLTSGGGNGLINIGLVSDGTFSYFLLPICFLIVVSFVDEPKLNIVRTIGICIFSIFLIYLTLISYANTLDVKNGLEDSFSELQYTEEDIIKNCNQKLSYFFFCLFALINLIISNVLLAKEKPIKTK